MDGNRVAKESATAGIETRSAAPNDVNNIEGTY